MKRSAQIGLVVGTLGVAGIGGEYLMLRQDACRDDAQPPVTGNAATDCRRSSSSGGSSSSGSSRSYFGSSDSSRGSGRPILPSASTSSSSTSEASRGGFGSMGRAIAAFSGGS